jgi:outer membrane lipoprotein-sorting protein
VSDRTLTDATRALLDAPCPPGPPPELVAATVAAATARLAGTTPAGELAPHSRRRMRMRLIGYATAGVALAAALVWAAGTSAEAQVQRAAEEAGKAKSFRSVRRTGATIEAVVTVQGNALRREEPDKSVLVIDFGTRTALALDLVAKTATRSKLSADEADALANQLADARDVLGFYRRLKADVKRLENEKIGTRDTHVYTIAVPVVRPGGVNLQVKRTLWQDPKTGLPVRFACHEATGDVVSDFESWNEEFPAALFECKVPPGFREVKE